MSSPLRDKADITLALLDRGAEVVEMVGENLTVRMRGAPPNSLTPEQAKQSIINVTNTLQTSVNVEASLHMDSALELAVASITTDKDRQLLRESIAGLREAAKAGKATSKKVTDAAKWVLDLGKGAFVALAPSLLKLLVTGSL